MNDDAGLAAKPCAGFVLSDVVGMTVVGGAVVGGAVVGVAVVGEGVVGGEVVVGPESKHETKREKPG
jgi:hypothetical protein